MWGGGGGGGGGFLTYRVHVRPLTSKIWSGRLWTFVSNCNSKAIEISRSQEHEVNVAVTVDLQLPSSDQFIRECKFGPRLNKCLVGVLKRLCLQEQDRCTDTQHEHTMRLAVTRRSDIKNPKRFWTKLLQMFSLSSATNFFQNKFTLSGGRRPSTCYNDNNFSLSKSIVVFSSSELIDLIIFFTKCTEEFEISLEKKSSRAFQVAI